jgi:cold shock CspA family protein
MPEGIITRFDAEIGYGFAEMEDGAEIYVHRAEIATPGVRSLKKGDRIFFYVFKNEKGAVAVDIELLK